MKLSVIIPAYNEEHLIQELINKIISSDVSMLGIDEKEIILIDDGSIDKTVEKAVSTLPSLKLIRHMKNEGKGAALNSGIHQATGDIILFQDADLEYSPCLYPMLLEPIVNGNTDVVYGSRFRYNKRPNGMRLSYILANRLGTLLINILYGTNLTDAMTCFKVFKNCVLKDINLECKGFGADCAEITKRITQKGFKIKEVPIPYRARTFMEGKKFRRIYSLHVLWAIVKYAFI